MKKVSGFIKLQMRGGEATESPALMTIARTGLNPQAFVQRFNALTSPLKGQPVRATVTIYKDRSFTISV